MAGTARPGNGRLCFAGGLFVSLAVLGGCSSLLNGAGRALDGSAFREKTIALYRSGGKKSSRVEVRRTRARDGAESLVISASSLPEMILRSGPPDPEGNAPLKTLRFLCSSVSGWNEFSLDLAGSVFFASSSLMGERRVLRMREAPRAIEISQAAARYKDSKISGEEALISLRNRRERILALTAWMRSFSDVPALKSREEFEAYWKPRLLPERAGRKQRPGDWKKPGDQLLREGDIAWNRSYTERVFPENLRLLRNSGALLRDWDEAAAWIYLEYNWEHVFALFREVEVIER